MSKYQHNPIVGNLYIDIGKTTIVVVKEVYKEGFRKIVNFTYVRANPVFIGEHCIMKSTDFITIYQPLDKGVQG